MTQRKHTCIFTALIICFASSLSAQTLLINFGSADTTSPDTNGNYWNNIVQGNTTINLVDMSTGVDTGFDYTRVTAPNTDFKTTSGGPTSDNAALGNLGIGTSTASSLFVPGNSGNTYTCTFSNLNPADSYDFVFFGSRQSFGNPREDRFSKYELIGATTEFTVLQTSGVGTGITDGYNVSNTATISGISPNVSGVITFNLTTNNGTQGYINALQMTVVPEPEIYSAIFGGILLLVCVYRRKKR